MSDSRCRSLSLEPEESGSLLGNIYIGKVKNIVKNINAAFIDLGGGKTGYYSLSENREHRFTSPLAAAGAQQRPGSSSFKPRPGACLKIAFCHAAAAFSNYFSNTVCPSTGVCRAFNALLTMAKRSL